METINGLTFITWAIGGSIISIFLQRAFIWRAKAQKFDALQKEKYANYIPTVEELINAKTRNKVLDAFLIVLRIVMPKIAEYVTIKRAEIELPNLIDNLRITKTLDEVI